ncbi:MAG: hypothetical protein AABX33_05190 [Nanoarchaeota archaeon]
MKLINKKLTKAGILIVTLISLLSTAAHSDAFSDTFANGLMQINDFFEKEQYGAYAKTIDFFFFALLFISIYLIGVRYAFKEANKPEKAIAVVLGIMSAFLMVSKDYSLLSLIPYVPLLLYLLIFLLFWLMFKGVESKFLRFVLALFFTFIAIFLIEGLFESLAPEDFG